MKTLREYIAEMASGGATCAGSVAAAPGSLFGSVIKRNPPKKKKKTPKKD